MFRYVKFAPIGVADQDRALAFYRDKLGLKLEVDEDYEGKGWRWIEFSMPGAQTRLLFEKADGGAASGEPALVFIVEDVEATAAELIAKGVDFTQPPKPAPWDSREYFALFRDSEGNLLQIGARRAAL
ncbi:MAG: VOC family protein [Cucumibacter sp.]